MAHQYYYESNRNKKSRIKHGYNLKPRTDVDNPLLDYYVVDLNEEMSVIDSSLLYAQMQFVNDVVNSLLRLYGTTKHGDEAHVILIGHSMGGLVAKGLPLLKSYIPGTVKTIITLATPHQKFPLMIDFRLHILYEQVITIMFVFRYIHT